MVAAQQVDRMLASFSRAICFMKKMPVEKSFQPVSKTSPGSTRNRPLFERTVDERREGAAGGPAQQFERSAFVGGKAGKGGIEVDVAGVDEFPR